MLTLKLWKIFKIKENPQVINLSEKQANYSCVINVLNYMLWYITYMRIWNIISVKTHFQNPIGPYNLLLEKLSQEIITMVLENHLTLKIFRPKKFFATKISILSSKTFLPKITFWPRKFVDWNINWLQELCTLITLYLRIFLI